MKTTCGCCEGIEILSPLAIANRPGLDALSYRVGTHSTFLETMKARLSSSDFAAVDPDGSSSTDASVRVRSAGPSHFSAPAAGQRVSALRGLSARAADDPAIALLDAWATVADVLTFYQERIANEGFLRTATERRSVLELARLVGYALRPGVSSSVYLAYLLDGAFKEEVVIPRGARSQSVPGPGELPQSFETGEDLKARASWNNLKPRVTRPQSRQSILSGSAALPGPRIFLKGINTNLKPGNMLLIESSDPIPFRVVEVIPDPQADRTLVKLEAWAAGMARISPRADVKTVVARYKTAAKFGVSATGASAKRILAVLKTVEARAAAGATDAELADFVATEALPRLSADLEEARQRGFVKLASWMGAMVPELRQAVGLELAPANAADAVGAGKGLVQATQLVAALTQPPSVQVANSSRLARRLSAEFAPKGAAGYAAASAFAPVLADTLATAVANAKVTPDPAITVYAMRTKAAPFGYNAPPRPEKLHESRKVVITGEWTISDPHNQFAPSHPGGPIVPHAAAEPVGHHEANLLYLDNEYDLLTHTWVAIDNPTRERGVAVAQVGANGGLRVEAAHSSFVGYGLSGKSTLLTLHEFEWFDGVAGTPGTAGEPFDTVRRTSVYLHSEELELAEEPIEADLCEDENGLLEIELDGFYDGLESGRWVVVSGERALQGTSGVRFSELAMLAVVEQKLVAREPNGQESDGQSAAALSGDKIHTFITLATKLNYCFTRDSVRIYGNVVKATNGETRTEVLGSGDASKAFQSFPLKQPPLTYVSAPTPAGAESTLRVYVNDVEWHETDALAGLSPVERRFVTRTDDDGKTTVILGNGREGARAPTGLENIRAEYRNGIGKSGNVRAEQITLLTTRPLGVKEVTNPLRATGGADKESRDRARTNAPLAVQALDRLVSTPDYEDFARTFAGIGKAYATRLSDGRQQLVHVTVAGADDIPIDENSDVYRNLLHALRAFGDPYQPVALAVRELMLVFLSAGVRLLPDYQWEPVVTALRTRLLDAFGFERRELGQDVTLSEVISVMHTVRGVAFVDVDALGGIPEKTVDDGVRRFRTPEEIAQGVQDVVDASREARRPAPRVRPNLADFEEGAIRPAQLAYLSPDVPATLILNQIT